MRRDDLPKTKPNRMLIKPYDPNKDLLRPFKRDKLPPHFELWGYWFGEDYDCTVISRWTERSEVEKVRERIKKGELNWFEA